jgi:dTMP kinase
MNNPTPKNFFVVIEGLDGSGKTGVSTHLLHTLQQTLGDRVQLSFEPHDPSAGGLFIRQILSKQIRNVSPVTLALAFALNRMDHNQRVIDRFLNGGDERVLLCDRYYLSSLVYQATDPLTLEDVMHFSAWARRPDLTLFLDVKPATSYARMRSRPQDKELFEQNLGARRETYHQAIAFLRNRGDQIVEIDANPDFPTVVNAVLSAIIEHGPAWLRVQRPLLTVDATPVIIEPSGAGAINLTELQAMRPAAIRETVGQLPAASLTRLLIDIVQGMGYGVGEPLAEMDALALPLNYTLPGGIIQQGTMLVLGENQRYDVVTRQLQALMNGDASDVSRLSDFLLVLDTRMIPEVAQHYERDTADPTRRISPAVRIFTREGVANTIIKL